VESEGQRHGPGACLSPSDMDAGRIKGPAGVSGREESLLV